MDGHGHGHGQVRGKGPAGQGGGPPARPAEAAGRADAALAAVPAAVGEAQTK